MKYSCFFNIQSHIIGSIIIRSELSIMEKEKVTILENGKAIDKETLAGHVNFVNKIMDETKDKEAKTAEERRLSEERKESEERILAEKKKIDEKRKIIERINTGLY